MTKPMFFVQDASDTAMICRVDDLETARAHLMGTSFIWPDRDLKLFAVHINSRRKQVLYSETYDVAADEFTRTRREVK